MELENNIIQGDSLEIMKEIPSNSVDLSFADPPFNLDKKYLDFNDKMTSSDYIDWSKIWIEELVRITKNSGSIFIHNIPKWLINYGSIMNDFGLNFKNWIVWDAPTGLNSKPLKPDHYGILYYTLSTDDFTSHKIRTSHGRCRKCNYLLKDYGGKKNMLHPYGPLLSDVWTDIHRVRHGKYKLDHPNHLPIPLLERIILMSSEPNDLIFDPFLGVGTTAIAAKRMGRKYLGIELSSDYIEIATRELEKSNQEMFYDIYISKFKNKIVTIRDCDWEKIKDHFYIPSQIEEIDFKEISLTEIHPEQQSLYDYFD